MNETAKVAAPAVPEAQPVDVLEKRLIEIAIAHGCEDAEDGDQTCAKEGRVLCVGCAAEAAAAALASLRAERDELRSALTDAQREREIVGVDRNDFRHAFDRARAAQRAAEARAERAERYIAAAGGDFDAAKAALDEHNKALARAEEFKRLFDEIREEMMLSEAEANSLRARAEEAERKLCSALDALAGERSSHIHTMALSIRLVEAAYHAALEGRTADIIAASEENLPRMRAALDAPEPEHLRALLNPAPQEER